MNELKNERIVIEVQQLVQGIENFKEEVDIYCDLVRQMLLSGSGIN